jgi:ATP-binding cassette subfamily A (ABC1) protein 3
MFLVLLLYGMSATLFSYLVSVLAKSQLGAFAIAAGTQGLVFVISIVVFTVSRASSLKPSSTLTFVDHRIV